MVTILLLRRKRFQLPAYSHCNTSVKGNEKILGKERALQIFN